MGASIWYISKYISLPSSGKWGTRGFMLAREWVRSGHRCLMLASDANHLADAPEFKGMHFVERVEGVEVCWVKTHKFDGAKSLGRILSWIDFERNLWRLPKDDFPPPDVVIVSSLSLLTILNGIHLKRRYGCRLVFEIRDIWPLTIVEEGGYSKYNPFVLALGLIERFGYRNADAIVGTMPNLVEHVRGQVKRHGPVSTIPIGLDPDALREPMPLPEDWREKHLPDGKFVVCHAGTIGITNALDTLFECARRMRAYEGVHFMIVGEGGLRQRYEAECADLPNVTFTGPVPKQMVKSVLEEADLLYFSVHRSRVWQYGMSLNKAVDYMMAAKPIVGSYTGYPTMIEDAGAGSEVPAGDVDALIAEILRYRDMSPQDRAAIGARGRDWLVRNRPYEKLAKEYLDIALPADQASGRSSRR
jgi:glycosyltransferase involved in cell wall biosynthesis